jgi:DNA-binding transcriptional LysR family regulator
MTHAAQRPHRPAHQAARPPRPDHSGAGRQQNKAASFLNTTQPAVSKSIKELERTVGVRLLERSAQGVEPTLYGRALLNGGTAVFDDLRLAVKNIESLTDPQAGEVRIGCGSWLAPCFVAAIIERLARRYPRIEFRIVTPPLEMLRRELHERRVDVLIEGRLAPRDELSDFELLYEETQVIATGVNNPWARRRRVKLSDLANETWVLATPESVFGFMLREDFQAAGFDFPPTTVFTNIPDVRMTLLASGRYLTPLPASLLRFPPERPHIKVLPFPLPKARVAVELVTLKKRMISPAAQLFIDTAREVAKLMSKRRP